jgi:hypothetical protein
MASEVTVLIWSHKYGRDVTVYASEDLAERAGAAIVGQALVDEIGTDNPEYRVGSDHEEDVVGGRARCGVCGWVDEANPDDPTVMAYHGDGFPERDPREQARGALAEGRHRDAIALFHEHLAGDDDDVCIQTLPVISDLPSGELCPVPGHADRNNWVVAEAAVATALVARDISAYVDRTGGVGCLAIPVTTPLPDRCPACGNLEVRYGGGHAARCSGCGRIADQETFEVGLCEVLAATHGSGAWNAIVQIVDTGDCLGDTCTAGLDPLAPSGAHPELVADVLLALDWPGIVRRSAGRI